MELLRIIPSLSEVDSRSLIPTRQELAISSAEVPTCQWSGSSDPTIRDLPVPSATSSPKDGPSSPFDSSTRMCLRLMRQALSLPASHREYPLIRSLSPYRGTIHPSQSQPLKSPLEESVE